MKNTLEYQNLATILNLKATISKLDDYLFHVKNNLEEQFNNFNASKELSIDRNEHVISLDIDELTIKVGFNWEYDDVYLGIRLYVPRISGDLVIDMSDKLKKYGWGYGKEEKYLVVSHERQLVEFLYSNEDYEKEWQSILEHFLERIDECKILVKELKSIKA